MIKDPITFIKRIIVTTIGCLIVGFGLGMMVVANIGGDPVTVFVTSIANLYPILTVGNWNAMFSVLMITLTLIVNRKLIGITTIIFTLIGQFTIDLCIAIVPTQTNLIGGIIVILIGIVIIGVGVAIMNAGDMGLAGLDAFILAVAGKFNTTYKKIRWITDAIFLVVGYLLGGQVGVGTIVCLLFTGYGIDTAMKLITPPIKKLIIKSK